MVICKPSTAVPRRDPPPPESLDLFVCPFTVLQDTREQAPWAFNGIVIEKRLWIVPRVVGTLATGDYTVEGCADRLVIERKSSADLVGSVTSGNARFRREHERMNKIAFHLNAEGFRDGFACVIVEGSLAAICDELDQEAGRRVTSESILGAVASWPWRYGVHWLFAGDRRRAELLAFKVMLKWWKEHGIG